MLYYRAVITREVITGIYYTYIHTIQMVTKVGSDHRVPASDSRIGAERTFVPTALCVDLCGGATGQVETT